MISYHFPPLAGAGVFRTLKFVKYLPGFDWQPIILSINKSKFVPEDETLIEEIPKLVKIYRTNTIESKIYTWGPSFIGINPKWYQIPDAFLGWLPFALSKAKEVVKKEKPSVIYSTSPPATSHLIAMLLKEKTGLPWVADFRDPWTDFFTTSYPTKIHRNIEEHLEHKVAKYADKIILNTEPNRIGFLKNYPDISPKKCITIMNGYDPDDFKNIEIKKSAKFTITHTGTFVGRRSPTFFLEALRNAIRERETLKRDMEVTFVGRLPREYWNIANKYGLNEIVKEGGYVSHEKAIKYMVDSTCLLLVKLLGKGSEGLLPGKIFEYIASGTPIIATVPTDSIAADLIKETNTGKVINTNDVDGIKNAILDFYDKWKNNKLTMDQNWDVIKKYSRKELTIKLANIFNEFCKK